MRCNICNKEIQGQGHNAEPLTQGKCCEICKIKVIEKRIGIIDMQEKENTNKIIKEIEK